MKLILLIQNTCLVSKGSSQRPNKSINHLNIPAVRTKTFLRSHITYITGMQYTLLPPPIYGPQLIIHLKDV